MRVKQRERAFRTSTMLCILAVCLALCSLSLSLSARRVPMPLISLSRRRWYRVTYVLCFWDLGLTLETVGSLTKPIFHVSRTRADHQRRLATTGWVLLCGRGVAEREDAPDGSSMTEITFRCPILTRGFGHDTTTPHTVRRRRSGARDRRVRSVQTGRATAAAGKTGR